MDVPSVTDARRTKGRGEPGNAVLDLSVSARAHILHSDGKLESRKLRAGTHGITVHVDSLESSNPFSVVREGGRPKLLKE